MWDFLEPEEQTGRYWHRLVGGATSYPSHPQAAVNLDAVRVALGVFFRGLGGKPELQIAAGMPQVSNHRLSLRQRLGLDKERIDFACCNGERVLLPGRLDCFPSAALNRHLYFWLAGFFAAAGPAPTILEDPLQADLRFLNRSYRTCRQVCRD